MPQHTIDERVTALEQQVARLERHVAASPEKNWRSTVGMFAGDPVMKEIIDEGRNIRTADRERSGE